MTWNISSGVEVKSHEKIRFKGKKRKRFSKCYSKIAKRKLLKYSWTWRKSCFFSARTTGEENLARNGIKDKTPQKTRRRCWNEEKLLLLLRRKYADEKVSLIWHIKCHPFWLSLADCKITTISGMKEEEKEEKERRERITAWKANWAEHSHLEYKLSNYVCYKKKS